MGVFLDRCEGVCVDMSTALCVCTFGGGGGGMGLTYMTNFINSTSEYSSQALIYYSW